MQILSLTSDEQNNMNLDLSGFQQLSYLRLDSHILLQGARLAQATVVTRMGNTADSGSYNTGFRCATWS